MRGDRPALDRAPSRSDGRSKLVEAKRRVRAVKRAAVAGAVALFALVGLAAKASHPGAHSSSSSSSGGTRATRLAPPADLVAAVQSSDDSGGGGFVAPAQGPPAASTGTS